MGDLFLRITRVSLVLLILFTVAIRSGNIGGHELFKEAGSAAQVAEFSISDVRAVFPRASAFKPVGVNVYNVESADGPVGILVSSSPVADSIVGYTAAVPVLIGVDLSSKIVGIHLLKNNESKDFVDRIVQSRFMEQWRSLSVQEAATATTDVVSGATVTSTALRSTIQLTLSKYSNTQHVTADALDWGTLLRYAGAVAVLVVALLQFASPSRFRRLRVPLQVASVAILGFWLGDSLSLVTLHSWLVYGGAYPQKIFLLVVLVLGIVLPLLTRKAFYCSYLCPFGAAQDLMGRVTPRKVVLPKGVSAFLSRLREYIFGAIVLLLALGISFDLTYLEPFSAFAFRTVSLPVAVLAILFLILSAFIPRAWCRFCCPTGQTLEIARKLWSVKSSNKKENES